MAYSRHGSSQAARVRGKHFSVGVTRPHQPRGYVDTGTGELYNNPEPVASQSSRAPGRPATVTRIPFTPVEGLREGAVRAMWKELRSADPNVFERDGIIYLAPNRLHGFADAIAHYGNFGQAVRVTVSR
jgi:hypothetical protein